MKTTSARVGLGLLLLAVLIQLALTPRWWQEAAESRGRRQELLRQERDAQKRLRELEKEAKLRAEAVALVGKSASTPPTAAALQQVRGRVVSALGGMTSARFEVRPAPPPAIATVGLATSGDFVDLVDLASALARPSSGFVLRRVSFTRRAEGVGLSLDAIALGTGSEP